MPQLASYNRHFPVSQAPRSHPSRHTLLSSRSLLDSRDLPVCRGTISQKLQPHAQRTGNDLLAIHAQCKLRATRTKDVSERFAVLLEVLLISFNSYRSITSAEMELNALGWFNQVDSRQLVVYGALAVLNYRYGHENETQRTTTRLCPTSP